MHTASSIKSKVSMVRLPFLLSFFSRSMSSGKVNSKVWSSSSLSSLHCHNRYLHLHSNCCSAIVLLVNSVGMEGFIAQATKMNLRHAVIACHSHQAMTIDTLGLMNEARYT